MSPEKVTTMILYVDLKCSCCYKVVRKLLCKFPQVRDQVFDKEKNKVTITVVCCNPEKMRDKLCCKGGKAIQSIEIVEPEPIKPTPPPPVVLSKPDPPKNPQQVKLPDPVSQPNFPPVKMPDRQPQPEPVKKPKPIPQPVCCQECYEGRGGGPCHCRYGRPVPPPPGPCYDHGYGYGYYGYYGYGYRPPCYVRRCDCFSEDNPQGCSIM